MTKRFVVFVVLAAFAAGAAWGEGSSEAAMSEKISLKMWDTASPGRLPFQTEVVEAFMKENPNAEVTFEGVPWGQYMEKVITSVAAGTAADAIRYTYVPDFASKGMILPLDDFMEKDNFDKSVFVRGSFGPTMTWKNKIYGLPFAINYYGTFYNVDTFNDNGIKEPASMEDFIAICKKLTTKDAGGAVATRAAQVIFGEDGMGANGQFLFMYGAKELPEQNQEAREFLLNSPEGIKGLTVLSDLYKSGAFIVMENEQAFVSGHVAMRIADNSNGWQITTPGRYPDLNVSWFPVPKPAAMPKRIHTGIFRDAVFIPVSTKNKDWAWKLATWYASGFGSGTVWQGKFGGIPPYNNISQKPPAVPIYKFYQDHAILAEIAGAIAGGVDVQPAGMWYQPAKKIELIINEEYQNAWNGDKTPKEALDSMDRRIEEIMRTK
jgi:multiple sugar transport system substrate-binding protein